VRKTRRKATEHNVNTAADLIASVAPGDAREGDPVDPAEAVERRGGILGPAVRVAVQVTSCALVVALTAWALERSELYTPLVEMLVHTGSESVSVVVCALAFVATWSIERRGTPVNASAAGALLLGAGLLDLFHAVSYVTLASSLSGLVESESRLFSAGSRFALAAGLVCYAWLPERPASERTRWFVLFAVLALTAALAGSATVLASTFARFLASEAATDGLSVWPGTTVVVLLIFAAARIFVARRDPDRESDVTLISACALFAIRELVILYGANGYQALPRLVAHGCEVAGCVLLYRGLVVRRLRRPAETATQLRTALRITEAQLLRAQAIAAFATYRVVLGGGARAQRLLTADAARLIGLDQAVRLPETEYRSKVVHADDRSALALAARQLMVSGRGACEYRVVLPGGDVRVIRDVAEMLAESYGAEVLGVLHDVTENRRIEDELRKLAAHVESAREAERIRIAREIHDELGGLLTGIRMELAMSVRQRAEPAGASASLEHTLQLIDSATDALRRVIRDLRPSILDDLGPVAAIEWYAEDRLRKAGLQVDFSVGAGAADLVIGGERASAVFRVAQEAMTNIVRHANARRVLIAVALEGDRLVLRIEDDGRGMDPDAPEVASSWGLRGMRERVRHFGGEMRIDGAPGRGTAVTVVMPLDRSDE